jgi:Zn-dependent protease with chaperone function
MISSTGSRSPDRLSRARSPSRWPADRGAARASTRASRAGLLLGLLGVASLGLVFVRLLESWRVSPRAASHDVVILGQRLSYPAANAGALIILGLALLGCVVTAMALYAIGTELRAAGRLARRLARLRRVRHGGAFVVDGERPEAFCAGLLRPRVYISTGALALLDEAGVNAVLAHELHHAERRDPLRLAAGRVIARSLFFLPALRELRQGQQLLAELSADESAVRDAAGDKSALARAMLSFSDAPVPGGSLGVHPARVDYLLGEPPSWRFPALLCVGAVALLGLLVAIAILAGREAAGSATLAPPFLSAQPCVVMLALIPCAVGMFAIAPGRMRRRCARLRTPLR